MDIIKITAKYMGRKIERTAYSQLQAWVIINTLAREGCTDIGMDDEKTNEQEMLFFVY